VILIIHSTQYLNDSADYSEQKIVGKPLNHMAALMQVTGEARYTDDIPLYHNELYGAMVLSTKAHAKIKKVDFAGALELPGVKFYVDHNDLPDPQANWWGAPNCDGNTYIILY
jgi:xanthine dehydrogenase/oxidase